MCGECSYKLDLFSFFRDKAYETETQLLLSKAEEANEVKAEVIYWSEKLLKMIKKTLIPFNLTIQVYWTAVTSE
jgi:hypothetical protein